MSRFIIAVLALVALLVGIIVVAPGLIPIEAYKGRVEKAASDVLGRQVTIGDNLRFKLVPRTAFQVADLQIANAEGFADPYLAFVREADIGVKLLPMLTGGAIEIERFVLTEPDINLARAKDGAVNWNLATPPAADAQAQGATRDVALGDVRIVDGKLSYADAAAGKTYDLDDIDAAVTLKSLKEPLEIDGAFKFEGAPSRAKLVLTSLAKMMAKEPAGLKLDLVLGTASGSADVTIETEGGLAYSGPMSLNAPDLPAFAKMMGTPLAEAPGFDKLAVKGEARGGPTSLRLTNADIDFDAIDAVGAIGLAWGGARPKATGRLNVGALDLRPYLPPPATGQGFPAWSNEKLDFASLRNMDADLDVAAEQIFLNDLKFGASRMKLKIENGRMVADIPELGMYGGGGSGQLVVNARQATPSITGKFDLGSVQAEPFTKDLMKIDKLLGLGGFNMEFSASGSSQAAIMRSMDGKGGFDVADGAIKGVNLAKLVRAVNDARKAGLTPAAISRFISAAQQPDEKTDFSEFLSEFTIANGAVTIPTITLKGPYLSMTGFGVVDLPAQTFELRLSPRGSTSIDGATGYSAAIPLRAAGTFSKPGQPSIDLQELLLGEFRGGGLIDLFKQMTGRRSETPAEEGETPAEESDPASDILEGIFGPTTKPSDGAASQPAGSGTPTSGTPEDALKKGLEGIFGRKPSRPASPAPSPAPAPA
ncbi:MAG: AsmA family protein, partial [Parvularculaceae bacterium]|nr:AsmA family protein [Parvularculaceae bacterium]